MSALVARLTPPGKAALATLGLVGAGVWEVVRALFRLRSGGMLPGDPISGRIWLGKFGTDLADEVVLAVRQVEPVLWVEIHCHGGPEVVGLLLELLRQRGLSETDLPVFRHAIIDNDPIRILAEDALTRAPSVRTASILLDQCQGALRSALKTIDAELGAGNKESALGQLEALSARSALGLHLTTPWRVVIAGAPNVGKSSLVNALAGYQRSIVSPIPGTTRDVVTTQLAFDGWPVELSDTAGLRTGGEELEEAGIARARQTLSSADLVLWLLDASGTAVWPESESEKILLVVNKIDLSPAWPLTEAAGALRVSAQTGAGLAELIQSISTWLVPNPPAPGEAVPFTSFQVERIRMARDLVRGGNDAGRERLSELLR